MSFKYIVISLLLFFHFLLSSQASLAMTCQDLFPTAPSQKYTQWRESITNGKKFAIATSVKREREIRAQVKELHDIVINEDATPSMVFVPADGVKLTPVVESGGYGSGIIPRYRVHSTGGVLSGTLLLPVSGHLGNTNARQWAKSDTYEIIANGSPFSNDNVTEGVKQKSLGIITLQNLHLPLIPGIVLRLSYNRSGSAGPGGFSEGRNIEFIWSGY